MDHGQLQLALDIFRKYSRRYPLPGSHVPPHPRPSVLKTPETERDSYRLCGSGLRSFGAWSVADRSRQRTARRLVRLAPHTGSGTSCGSVSEFCCEFVGETKKDYLI